MIFETNYYQASGLHNGGGGGGSEVMSSSHVQPENIPITPSSSNSPSYEPEKRPVSCLSPSSLQSTPVSLKKASQPAKANCKKAVRMSNDAIDDSLCKVELVETPQSLSMCSSSSACTSFSGQCHSPVHAVAATPNSTLYQIQSEQLPYELVEPIHTIFSTAPATNGQPDDHVNANCFLEPSRSGSASFPALPPHAHSQHDYQLASYSSYPYMSESGGDPTAVPPTYAATSSYSHPYYSHQHQQQQPHVEAEYHVAADAYHSHQDYQYQYAQPGDYLSGSTSSQNQGVIYDGYCETSGFYLNNQHHQLQAAYDMETPVNYAAPYALDQDYMGHGVYQQRAGKFSEHFETDEESGLDSDSDGDSLVGDEHEVDMFHGQQQSVRRAYTKKKAGNAAGSSGGSGSGKAPTKRARKLKQSLDDELAAGDMSQAAKRKRKRILNRLQRAEATMREKRRMLKLNKAFEDLRKVLPITEFAKNKLSRADTLKSAIEYIEKMSEMLTLC